MKKNKLLLAIVVFGIATSLFLGATILEKKWWKDRERERRSHLSHKDVCHGQAQSPATREHQPLPQNCGWGLRSLRAIEGCLMGFLFSQPKPVAPPTIEDPEIEEERRRQLRLRQATGGRQATIISGGAGITTPILGSAAALGGGAP